MKIGFIGIDIHHPPSASHDRPSEAAISISCNPGVTSYYSTFRYKKPKELVTKKPYLLKFKFRSQDRGLEEVREFRAMSAEAFDKITVPFDCLVVIRDGIATTQFESTANKELEDLNMSPKTILVSKNHQNSFTSLLKNEICVN